MLSSRFWNDETFNYLLFLGKENLCCLHCALCHIPSTNGLFWFLSSYLQYNETYFNCCFVCFSCNTTYALLSMQITFQFLLFLFSQLCLCKVWTLTVLLSTRVPCLLTALLFTHRQPKIETCVIQCTTQKEAARSTILCMRDSIRA